MANSQTMKCRDHGGRASETHAGSANGMFIDGRTMKYSGPELFNQEVKTKLADPLLLDQSEEISILTTLVAGEIKRLGMGVDPAAFLPELDRLVNAMQTSNSDEIRGALNRLLELSKAGSGRVAIENRILKLFERRRKLVESQRRHVIALRLWLSPADAKRNVEFVLAAVTRNVKDPAAVRAILDDLRTIMGDVALATDTVH